MPASFPQNRSTRNLLITLLLAASSLAAGFADYLTKPLDFTHLYAVLAQYLGDEPDA